MEQLEQIKLLLKVVRKQYTNQNFEESGRAIITALEGLKCLVGENSTVDEAWLRNYLNEP